MCGLQLLLRLPLLLLALPTTFFLLHVPTANVFRILHQIAR